MKMKDVSWGLIVGISIGVLIGLLLACAALLCAARLRRRASGAQRIRSSSSRRASTVPMRTNGLDCSTAMSDSTAGGGDDDDDNDAGESPKASDTAGGAGVASLWLEGVAKKRSVVSMSGIPSYCYKDLQKATSNFTTVIGEGAFGPVYKAQMSTGETVAVKVLSSNSKQGEKEFQSEVLLLGRLHHRNLVNLIGYCAEKNQHMLIYVYMPNGSLASHLYNVKHDTLCWDLRIYIALDVARGVEYLHDGAIPPVVHRDIKSSNILLDRSMRARVADFGLSREESVNSQAASIRGTYGYLDPEYISSRTFTKKSDVYSFGVLLFELIAGRNPQQGLMEYVELAAMNTDGRVGWEEIADSRLDGNYNVEELNDMAALAYRCVNKSAKKRPSMRDIVQSLSGILKDRHSRKHRDDQDTPSQNADTKPAPQPERPAEVQICISDDHRDDSGGSVTDLPEV